MTNKQIIIDNVDVSGCEHCLKMTKYRCTIQHDPYKYLCEENPNCHYKQFKRSEAQCEGMFVLHTDLEKKYEAKEQECEKLKEGYLKLTDIVSPYMDDFTGYNEELGGFDIVLCVKELMEQLDQLKANNKKLQEVNDTLTITREKLLGELYIAEESLKDYETHYNRQCEEFDQLKVENERLEAHLATLDAVIETGRVQYKALKQTLVKVKNMIEKSRDKLYDCDSIIYADDRLVEILDVINEVLPHDNQQ